MTIDCVALMWDGTPKCTDEFFEDQKEIVYAQGEEMCRFCRQKIHPGSLIKRYELFKNQFLFYHFDGFCKKQNSSIK